MSPTIFIPVVDAHGRPDTLPKREYVRNTAVTPEREPAPEVLAHLRNRLDNL